MAINPAKVYYGKPCAYGHDGLRWKVNNGCVECRRISAREYMVGYRQTRKEKSDAWREANRDRMVWLKARQRAAEKGVPFTVTVEDLPPIPELCPVFGIELRWGIGAPTDNSPSLDRIVPELGYVPGNIHWISNRANTLKRDATPEELRKVADYFTRLERSRSVGA